MNKQMNKQMYDFIKYLTIQQKGKPMNEGIKDKFYFILRDSVMSG